MSRVKPFNKHLQKYEKWFIINAYAYFSELFAVKSLLTKKALSIEIGVGSGRFSTPFGIKLGIDPSRKMRALSKRRNISVIDSIGESLPLRTSIFDIVLMVTTICFIDDIAMAFKEVHRILKPHGCFIIGFIDRNSQIGKSYEENKESNVFYRFADFYTVDEVLSHLRKADFRQFSFRQTIFHPLSEIKQIEKVKNGYGEGSFVVISARI
ncbi:MAG: class I SAM-dependent methyltransferase [Promethearchaeota archaeon]|nr:MAG: class I SAM-dependent methyltransferase [Candidatus Lokiarchaeota archaeon]